MTQEEAIEKLDKAIKLIDEVYGYIPDSVRNHCGNFALLATEELKNSIKFFEWNSK